MADEQNRDALDEEADAFYDDKQIELNLKVMRLAQDDPDFRAHMQDNPEEALEKAGLLEEARAIAEADAQDDDVAGHRSSYYRTCRWWQYRILWHRR